MSFTVAQQIPYRRLVKLAWEAHCRAQGFVPTDGYRSAQDLWYRAQLREVLGVYTTKQCNRGKDYEALMAHFEVLSGDGIDWQLRYHIGDVRRLQHMLGALLAKHHISEEYAAGIARQALQLEDAPELSDLDAKQLLVVLRAVKIYAARRLTAGASLEQQR